MRNKGLTVVEQALIATGVLSVLALMAIGTVAAVAVRGVRRRYRSVHERLRVIRGSRRSRHGSIRTPISVAVATIGSPRWWAVQNRRHQMWRAVSSAEHAVGVARRSDVALGELPVLTGQLRAAALGVDSVLRASARLGSLREEDRTDCDRIETAAADIHAAALSSLRSVSHTDTDPIVSAVHIEVAALAAGVRAALH